MASLNSVAMTGNLVRDAEVQDFNNGGIIKLTMAVNDRPYTSKKTGERVERTNFIDVEKRFGEKGPGGILDYLTKGKAVAVSGAISQQKWTNADGENRSKIVVSAYSLDLIGGSGGPTQERAPKTGGTDVPF